MSSFEDLAYSTVRISLKLFTKQPQQGQPELLHPPLLKEITISAGSRLLNYVRLKVTGTPNESAPDCR